MMMNIMTALLRGRCLAAAVLVLSLAMQMVALAAPDAVSPTTEPNGGTLLSVRTFTVRPGMTCSPPIRWDTPEQREENNARWRALFSEGGVTWPDGSYLCHVPAFEGLVVKNTAENLDIIAALCRHVQPKRIRVSAQLWAIGTKVVKELGLDAHPAVISSVDWQKLQKRLTTERDAEFLACPSVVAGNNEEAVLDGMGKCRFPKAAESDGETSVESDEFEEIGGRFMVLPSIGHEEDWTSLQVSLSYDFPPIFSNCTETGSVAIARCPAFCFRSSLTLRRDEVAVIGGFPAETPGAVGRRLLFSFLTADIPERPASCGSNDESRANNDPYRHHR